MSLPNHVPITIDKADIEKFNKHIMDMGYSWIFLQIVKPKQIVGRVKSMKINDQIVDHHIRVFTNGVITSEYEPLRVNEMWRHLTTLSYSAHEKVIEYLKEANIKYSIDNELRERYNREADPTFPKRFSEIFEWFFAGVLFWVPIGWAWRGLWELRCKIFGNPLRKDKMKRGTIRDISYLERSISD